MGRAFEDIHFSLGVLPAITGYDLKVRLALGDKPSGPHKVAPSKGAAGQPPIRASEANTSSTRRSSTSSGCVVVLALGSIHPPRPPGLPLLRRPLPA